MADNNRNVIEEEGEQNEDVQVKENSLAMEVDGSRSGDTTNEQFNTNPTEQNTPTNFTGQYSREQDPAQFLNFLSSDIYPTEMRIGHQETSFLDMLNSEDTSFVDGSVNNRINNSINNSVNNSSNAATVLNSSATGSDNPAMKSTEHTDGGADDDDGEWEDEEYVFVELIGLVDPNKLQRCTVDNSRILGIEADTTVIKLGNHIFAGSYKEAFGSLVFLEETSPQQLTYKCHTTKTLNTSRAFLKKIKPPTSQNSSNASDEGENMETETTTVPFDQSEHSAAAHDQLEQSVNSTRQTEQPNNMAKLTSVSNPASKPPTIGLSIAEEAMLLNNQTLTKKGNVMHTLDRS